jgi:predicted ester cyclase
VSAHDVDALCALVADDWTLHGGPPGLPRGREGLRVLFESFGPIEQRWTVQDVVVEGDRVVVRATDLCRQEHFLGVPSHGREQRFAAMFLHRIEEDRIAETWRNADDLGRLLQLGARLEAKPESPLVARVRRVIDAHGESPSTDATEIHSPHVVVHAPGSGPLGGSTLGRDLVLAEMARMRKRSRGTFAPVATELSGRGPFVSVIHRVTATRVGRTLDQTLAELWRFDGTDERARCVEVWVEFEDVRAWEEFWK